MHATCKPWEIVLLGVAVIGLLCVLIGSSGCDREAPPPNPYVPPVEAVTIGSPNLMPGTSLTISNRLVATFSASGVASDGRLETGDFQQEVLQHVICRVREIGQAGVTRFGIHVIHQSERTFLNGDETHREVTDIDLDVKVLPGASVSVARTDRPVRSSDVPASWRVSAGQVTTYLNQGPAGVLAYLRGRKFRPGDRVILPQGTGAPWLQGGTLNEGSLTHTGTRMVEHRQQAVFDLLVTVQFPQFAMAVEMQGEIAVDVQYGIQTSVQVSGAIQIVGTPTEIGAHAHLKGSGTLSLTGSVVLSSGAPPDPARLSQWDSLHEPEDH